MSDNYGEPSKKDVSELSTPLPHTSDGVAEPQHITHSEPGGPTHIHADSEPHGGDPPFEGHPLPQDDFVESTDSDYQNTSMPSPSQITADSRTTPKQPDNAVHNIIYIPPDFEFSDQNIRRTFTQKVYSILMVQLSVTLGIICWFVYHEPTRGWVKSNPCAFFVALGVLLGSMIALSCCGGVRRKAPVNYVLLGFFTLAEAFVLSLASVEYDAVEVLMAVGITAVVCSSLTLFAFQTKYDFTTWGGILLVAVVILIVFGIVAAIVPSVILNMVYASLGALLFSVYLVYDTQLMLGGKHRYYISPDECVCAALNLYLDIALIFVDTLMLVSGFKN